MAPSITASALDQNATFRCVALGDDVVTDLGFCEVGARAADEGEEEWTRALTNGVLPRKHLGEGFGVEVGGVGDCELVVSLPGMSFHC